jgi:succinate dehydrogenase/fumarate reductase flavoprotein subunit
MSGSGRGAGQWDQQFDWVVIGAGVGGMTAALVGALEGLRTLLIERGGQVGGTSARSSGTVWIPDNPYQRRAGVDDRAAARQYLDALVRERAPPALRERLLSAGPEMVQYLDDRAGMRYRPYAAAPDYRQDLPGATLGGRALEPLPFDGRTLGAQFDRVAWPLRELMLFGGMMVTRGEIARLLKIGRNLDSLLLGARLTARFLWDRLRFRRGTRLVLGNALVARLYKALLDRDVPIWFNATTRELCREGGRVTGLVVEVDGRSRRVGARLGVVLAGGGFPASPELRERYLPRPTPQYTAACEGCVGDTFALAQAAGATLGPRGPDNALWFPSSVARRRDGTTAVYPHIVLDRAKPGLVAVNAAGRRFVNEGVSYHEFTRAMYRAHARTPAIPAWLVCDRRFLWKYGLGMVRPLTLRLRPHLANGYLRRADTIEALARAIGVAADGLAATVSAHNEFARTGVDLEFGKGGDPYDRGNGDPAHRPNPCLGPIGTPPYFAVAVLPTPLGTSLGLLTDADANVLDAAGRPIPGLYACGNDMHSPLGGEYPGPGAQLGPAMTFGYLAALHAARQAGAIAVAVPAR